MEQELRQDSGDSTWASNIRSNKPLNRRYSLSVIIAISLLVINAFYIHHSLTQRREDGTQINIAGRQRMLSQKLLVELYQVQLDSLSFELVRATATVWQAGHRALLQGSDYISIGPVRNATLHDDLDKLSPTIQSVVHAVESLPDSTMAYGVISQKLTGFLNQMDRIVFQLEREAGNRLSAFLVIEVGLLVLSMVIIFIEVRYVYMPFIQSLQESTKKIETQRAKFESIMNSTEDGIIYIDLDGNLININQAAHKLLRDSISLSLELKSNLFQQVPCIWQRAFQIATQRVLAGRSIRAEITLPINGDTRWLMASCFPVYNASQELIGMAVNLVNIDQQKRNELHIKNQNRRFKVIAARQSHDLRGKLASILGLLRIIRLEDTHQGKLQLVDRLEPLAEQMDEVIHEIVAETQLSEGPQV
ncbi:MAG TPA: hypothetical protein DCE41_00950 [Cytophagales bacterium]|nr:hypothetical protein [Cytophagales bacterium]HAA23471.1 hypothetical protein [Cytophagales bacterium]HAP58312.1 hypothetical protein [Cytophagales bacterium]